MAPPGVPRSDLTRSLERALWMVAASGVLLGVFYLAIVLPSEITPLIHIAFVLDFWVFLAAGILAWRLRPANGMGALIVVGGFAVYAGSLYNTGVFVLIVIGAVFATSVLATTVHMLHAFPGGRLRGRASQATVIGGYVVALVLQIPIYLFGADAPPEGLGLVQAPELHTAGQLVQSIAGAAVMIATAVILIARLRRADPAHRRTLLPLYGYGVFAVLFVPSLANILGPLDVSPEVRVLLQLLIVGGIPIAFALGVLRGGFARTRELEELAISLGSIPAGPPGLETALARTLGDPSVRLLYRRGETPAYVDEGGAPVEVGAPTEDRASVDVLRHDRPIALIVYNSSLIADSALVERAGQVVAIAVERERLTAELRASERELRLSRMRLVDASDRERRRIAQDLHDGLQVQLVLLALEAQQLAIAAPAESVSAAKATHLREGIDLAAGDLRRLVHAVMPSALIERGLSTATEDLVDRMPMPTTLELAGLDGSVPASVESTAYFVVAEGLANAVRHSRARSAAVRVGRHGDVVRVEISDDGVGGATLGGGAGLRGMADRVDALGGRLELTSVPLRGTRIRVELPCES